VDAGESKRLLSTWFRQAKRQLAYLMPCHSISHTYYVIPMRLSNLQNFDVTYDVRKNRHGLGVNACNS
jgi:hypothetical protein